MKFLFSFLAAAALIFSAMNPAAAQTIVKPESVQMGSQVVPKVASDEKIQPKQSDQTDRITVLPLSVQMSSKQNMISSAIRMEKQKNIHPQPAVVRNAENGNSALPVIRHEEIQMKNPLLHEDGDKKY